MRKLLLVILLSTMAYGQSQPPEHFGKGVILDIQYRPYYTYVVFENPYGFIKGFYSCDPNVPVWKDMRVDDLVVQYHSHAVDNKVDCFIIQGAQRSRDK